MLTANEQPCTAATVHFYALADSVNSKWPDFMSITDASSIAVSGQFRIRIVAKTTVPFMATASPAHTGVCDKLSEMENFYARCLFFVKDAEESLTFYTQTLGFALDWNHQYEGRAWVFQVSLFGFCWTREEAIEYFRPYATDDVASEIDRYIALPGQALAYKIGELRIREPRQRTQGKLGTKFDVRDFHDALLRNGALPLELLEEVIAREFSF